MGYDIVSLIPAFCAAFLGQSDFAEGRIAFQHEIDVARMDYSVGSLHALDSYLELAHENRDKIAEQDYTNTVLAAGCYLGEVIRRNGKSEYHWVNYADHFPKDPSLMAIFPEGLGTSAVLVRQDGKETALPLNKIMMFIEDGPDNSTHFFATRYTAKSN